MGKVLYVCEQGSVVRKTGPRVMVVKDRQVLLSVPAGSIANVLVFGMVQLTTQAAHALMDAGADVAFLTRNGRIKGVLSPEISKNVVVRLAQYRRPADTGFRLALARAIVRGKLRNQRVLVLRFQRREAAGGLGDVVEALDQGIESVETADLAQLRGIEGACTRAYFSSFRHLLREVGSWEGRSRRPPRDPVNALLSLGYVLLTRELGAILTGLSLDPYVGFLHGIKYGRESLALDVAEEFRHGLVDVLTLNLLRRAWLGQDDFVVAEDGGVVLADAAFKRYLSEYEARLADTVTDQLSGEVVTWRGLFRRQCAALREAIVDGGEYPPFVVR